MRTERETIDAINKNIYDNVKHTIVEIPIFTCTVCKKMVGLVDSVSKDGNNLICMRCLSSLANGDRTLGLIKSQILINDEKLHTKITYVE